MSGNFLFQFTYKLKIIYFIIIFAFFFLCCNKAIFNVLIDEILGSGRHWTVQLSGSLDTAAYVLKKK